MPRKLLTALALLATTSLTSCWSPFHDLTSGHALEPRGPAFARALHAGYVELSETRNWAFDLSDGEHFNLKAKAAAEGLPIKPDKPGSRDLPESEAAVLAEAHGRLWQSFRKGARNLVPRRAATAQFHYDCWLEAAAGSRWSDARDCSLAFEIAMAEVQLAMVAPPRGGVSAPPGQKLRIKL